MGTSDVGGHYYDHVVNTLRKESRDRTDQEIAEIPNWFRTKSEVFKNLSNEMITDILRNCTFETREKDDVVIEQGERGDSFYVILSGSVVIYINTNLEVIDGANGGPESAGETTIPPKEDTTKQKTLDRSKYGNYIGKIEAGKSFGELALINPDCIRNATIIADEETDLLVVQRELYNRSLRALQEQEFTERKTFVQTNELFANMQNKYKKQLAMSLRKEKMCFDSPLVRQGGTVDGLIFLLSGEVRILSDPTMHEHQYPAFFPLEDPEVLQKQEAMESLRRELSRSNLSPSRKKNVDRLSLSGKSTRSSHLQTASPKLLSPKPGRRSKSPHRHTIEMCHLSGQEIVGDLEAVLDLPTYAYSILCVQEVEFYVLDQKNYDRLIEKRSPKVKEMLKKSVINKYSLRLSWVHDNQIPLLTFLLYKLEKEVKRSLKSSTKKTQDAVVVRDTNSPKNRQVDVGISGNIYYTIPGNSSPSLSMSNGASNHAT